MSDLSSYVSCGVGPDFQEILQISEAGTSFFRYFADYRLRPFNSDSILESFCYFYYLFNFVLCSTLVVFLHNKNMLVTRLGFIFNRHMFIYIYI